MAESEFSEDAWLDALCARQRLDVVGDLAGGVAHQLNNALSVVNGYEELLLETLDEESAAGEDDRQELRARARTVHTWTATALAVARRLHSMAAHLRSETGPVEINGLVAEMVELCRYRCERENILLIADPGADLPHVQASSGELLQVLINLVHNAREAIGRAGTDGGTIRLTTTVAEHGVRIVVDDEGPGVAADDVESIFTIGVSAKTGPDSAGSGLGLPVSRRIVQRLGGTLRAEADEGGRFLIDLPA